MACEFHCDWLCVMCDCSTPERGRAPDDELAVPPLVVGGLVDGLEVFDEAGDDGYAELGLGFDDVVDVVGHGDAAWERTEINV